MKTPFAVVERFLLETGQPTLLNELRVPAVVKHVAEHVGEVNYALAEHDLNRIDFGVNNFAQLQTHLTETLVGNVFHTNVHFLDGTANAVTIDLVGVRLATLAADDFRFHP